MLTVLTIDRFVVIIIVTNSSYRSTRTVVHLLRNFTTGNACSLPRPIPVTLQHIIILGQTGSDVAHLTAESEGLPVQWREWPGVPGGPCTIVSSRPIRTPPWLTPLALSSVRGAGASSFTVEEAAQQLPNRPRDGGGGGCLGFGLGLGPGGGCFT